MKNKKRAWLIGLTLSALAVGFALGFFARLGLIEPIPLATPAEAIPPPTSSRHSAVVEIAQSVSPAVVTIGVTVASRQLSPLDLLGEGVFAPFDDRFGLRQGRVFEQEVPSVGSGFIVDLQGLLAPGQKPIRESQNTKYVLTNYHVVQDVRRINVTLTDGREYEARLLDADAIVDVALLELINPKNDPVPTVKLGDSADIMVGETAIALGNPFGPLIDDPHPTVTVGVISALNRSFQPEVDQRSGTARVYRNMIQTDASVNPGNSGGPLVNLDGEVIGINTFIISPGGRGSAGVNFATPINRAVAVAREILIYGSVRSIKLDFDVVPINRMIARRYGLKEQRGLFVAKLAPKGPAETCGIRQGDIIVKIEGKDVTAPEDLLGHMYSSTVGERLKFTVSRNGQRFDAEYEIQSADSI